MDCGGVEGAMEDESPDEGNPLSCPHAKEVRALLKEIVTTIE